MTRPPVPGAPGAVISQSGELRSARLESIRAVAALAVLFGHASYALPLSTPEGLRTGMAGGLLGVDLFFVLTGYLLFWPFLRAATSGDRVDLGRYALNRAVRVLPLYYFVVVVLLVVQHGGGTFEQWWRFGLFAENFSDTTLEKVDAPMWSLVVEIHFYALLPLLGLLLARTARRGLAFGVGLVAILGIASLVSWQALVVGDPEPQDQWKFSLPGRFWLFSAGMFVAFARLAWAERRPAFLRGWGASPAVWWIAAVGLWAVAAWHPQLEALTAPAGFLLVGSCVLLGAASDPVTRTLDWRPLALIGVASYSLYLWHVPVLAAFMNESLTDFSLPTRGTNPALVATAGIGVSIAIAAASYALIESPFLRLRRRWARGTAPQRDSA
ncbi:MAG TPA: acyltransferase [Thermoleophilaceae bacterium]|nr:acyltransferase [Thermoleophilaceae bacterium]